MCAYALCLYDATGRVLATPVGAAGVCGKLPCWKPTAAGYAYKDAAAAQAGVTRIALKASATDRSQVWFRGRGVNLHLPALPLQGTVTAQLTNNAGLCFAATYGGESIHRNIGTIFRASIAAP